MLTETYGTMFKTFGWAEDDLLDACALLLVAERIARGEGRRVPDAPLEDAAGLRAEIWF